MIKKVDEMREAYVKKYAGTSRYDTRNYDLVINMEVRPRTRLLS